MSMSIKIDYEKGGDSVYLTKKCPECYSYLLMQANECDVCETQVRIADNGGLAKKPINWMSYFHCFLAWLSLTLFVWLCFFTK